MAQNNYHQLLIAAYEDEIGGMAYFKALTDIFTETHQVEKLNVLVDLETQTSDALFTLIQKHNLNTQTKEHIDHKAIIEAKQAQGKTWQQLVELFAREFPPYIEEFKQCLELAPSEDKPILQQTVEHEIALIDFAQNEINGSTNPLDSINRHMGKYAPC